MPFEVFLALRYLRSRRKRRLARATAAAAVAGISVGVAALIVSLALANGFRDEMRDKILRGTAHITVMRNDGQVMRNYNDVAAQINAVGGVLSASGTTYDGALAVGSKGSAYAILRGIDQDSTQSVEEVKRWLSAGSIGPIFASPLESKVPEVIVGSDLASRTGLQIGSTIELLQPGSSLAPPSKRTARVAGVFHSGLFEYDSAWIYLSLDSAAAFTNSAHAASLISVQVNDLDEVKSVANRISSTLGGVFTVIDWQEANRPLFTALALERQMGLFIVGLIILVAMLNISTMLVLVVVERRRDIAILKAMGAGRLSITALFMIEGAIIGVFGALGGVALGILASFVGNRYKLVSLPADVYSISNVPFRPRPTEMLFAVLLVLLLSVAATIYPARAAARMRPAETLRD
jgi:lipoprotein-releasing system permease protein